MNTLDFLIVFVAFAFGGILRGATGAGAPIIVVPLLAMYNGVVFAVTVFAVPNLVSNFIQVCKFYKHVWSWKFVIMFAGAGAVGAAIGTVMLTTLSSDVLMGMGRISSQMWIYSLLAIIPLVGAMPSGSKLIQHVSKDSFDRIILILLFVLAAKLVVDIF